jgi:hypothetical protein
MREMQPGDGMLRSARRRAVDLYVPKRLDGGGLDGVPAGAAVAGTPGPDGLIEIDFELPTSPTRLGWIAAVGVAWRRRLATRSDEPHRVHPSELIRVGSCDELDLTITDPATLDRWLAADRGSRLSRLWPA